MKVTLFLDEELVIHRPSGGNRGSTVSRVQISGFPDRSNRNTILLPSAVTDGYTSNVSLFKRWASPRGFFLSGIQRQTPNVDVLGQAAEDHMPVSKRSPLPSAGTT